MSTLEEFIAEYRIGLIESAREDGFIEGKREGIEEGMEKGIEKGMEKGMEKGILQGRSYMRSVMIANYAETVRKAVSAGMSGEDAMALVPADIADEVAEALRRE